MNLEQHFRDYFKEEYNAKTIVNEHGFIVYSFHGKECLVRDFFVKEASRKTMEAKKLFSMVVLDAGDEGAEWLTGIIATSEERAEKSTRLVKAYMSLGLEIYSVINGHVCMRLKLLK